MQVKTLGGLKDIERKALNLIFIRNGYLTRYSISKLLKIEKKKSYRIVNKLTRFGYVEITEKRTIIITKLGEIVLK